MALATRPKQKVHHKKRRAAHHRHSKTYLRSYWPYLPMLLIVGLGLLVNTIWSNSSAVLSASADFSNSSLLLKTNVERNKNNLPSLTLDSQLSAAAQAKAEDMVSSDYWAHNSPGGKSPWSFIAASGYQYQTAGENLAYGFDGASDTIRGWMNSPEHKSNILSTDYQNVGFGVASTSNFQGHGPQTVVVAEYGRPIAAVANISFNVDSPAKVKAAESTPVPVSRIQVLTGGQATWSLAVLSAVAGAALMLFILRHGLRLKRVIRDGERFVTHHPYLDIAFVLIITVGFVLTRSSGIIH